MTIALHTVNLLIKLLYVVLLCIYHTVLILSFDVTIVTHILLQLARLMQQHMWP